MTRCPDYAGRPGRSPRADPDRRVLAHQRMRRANSARHAASTAFAFTASRTGPRSLCRGEASRVPPGDVVYVEPRSRVPHPAPPSRHLATMPLGGRDGSTLDRNIIAVKRKSPEVNNIVRPAHGKGHKPALASRFGPVPSGSPAPTRGHFW